MTHPRLQVIVGSTRPGRIGRIVAEWVAREADQHGAFDVETVDLAQVGLPLLDEPEHPALGRYVHQHTKDWSATITRGDAFVFVIPEYNHGYNAATKNAIDYLHREWRYKAVGLVSYGGVAAGTRAAQALKPVLVSLKAVPVLESVAIPFAASLIDTDGALAQSDAMQSGAKGMLDELARVNQALSALRDASEASA
ncbi:NADPH-dependent FMN reductase [Streptomyces acidicola]|uniref:NADPH-dependent FMN reductase n=1 Tax=Streptomyces acidicola TaxID=2596892 RepID=UPI003823A680